MQADPYTMQPLLLQPVDKHVTVPAVSSDREVMSPGLL